MNYNYKNWRAVSNNDNRIIGAEFITEYELDNFLVKNPGFYKRYISNDEIKKERFNEIELDRYEDIMFGLEVKD